MASVMKLAPTLDAPLVGAGVVVPVEEPVPVAEPVPVTEPVPVAEPAPLELLVPVAAGAVAVPVAGVPKRVTSAEMGPMFAEADAPIPTRPPMFC